MIVVLSSFILYCFYRNTSHLFSVRSKNSSVTLDNLRKFGEYNVDIASNTRVGDGGQRSESITFRTLEDGMCTLIINIFVFTTLLHNYFFYFNFI